MQWGDVAMWNYVLIKHSTPSYFSSQVNSNIGCIMKSGNYGSNNLIYGNFSENYHYHDGSHYSDTVCHCQLFSWSDYTCLSRRIKLIVSCESHYDKWLLFLLQLFGQQTFTQSLLNTPTQSAYAQLPFNATQFQLPLEVNLSMITDLK